jgi:hypothetical protein
MRMNQFLNNDSDTHGVSAYWHLRKSCTVCKETSAKSSVYDVYMLSSQRSMQQSGSRWTVDVFLCIVSFIIFVR